MRFSSGEYGANVTATRREFDMSSFLDGMVPRDLIRHWRDVVHPIDDGHVLVVIQLLAKLLEAAVQIADVWNRLDDCSPSSVRTSRSVVCVAGCCGPKLRSRETLLRPFVYARFYGLERMANPRKHLAAVLHGAAFRAVKARR